MNVVNIYPSFAKATAGKNVVNVVNVVNVGDFQN
jgi:hypothetical protein